MLTRRQMMVALGAATLPLPLSAASVPVTLTPGLHPDRVAGHCNAWIQWHLSRPRNQTAPERNSAGAGGKRAGGRDPRTLAWHSVAQRDGRRKRADTGCHHPE